MLPLPYIRGFRVIPGNRLYAMGFGIRGRDANAIFDLATGNEVWTAGTLSDGWWSGAAAAGDVVVFATRGVVSVRAYPR